jgi:hypothetical protein
VMCAGEMGQSCMNAQACHCYRLFIHN